MAYNYENMLLEHITEIRRSVSISTRAALITSKFYLEILQISKDVVFFVNVLKRD